MRLQNYMMKKEHPGKLVTTLLFVLMALNIWGQETEHWYNVISTDDNCRYYVPDSNIGYDWLNKDFDDSGWTLAQSGIGYSDDDDNTVLPDPVYSVYIRYSFNLSDITSIKEMILDMDYDDGFVAYLNGVEVASANISKPYSWNMELDRDHEAGLYEGKLPERWIISSAHMEESLQAGENILAVEIHNHNLESSDLSSNFFLHINFTETQSTYRDVISWFTPPVTLFSHLPIVVLNTDGASIPDEPKITAEMGIIYTEGDTSSQYDFPNEFFGKVGIERRGESSSGFPKKQYALETRTDSGTNLNVSLLGMPRENDWILYAPYSDKSLIKNVLTYKLSEQMGDYAPRTRYVELILNGDYKGIYVLIEKIKEDSGRVDIATLRPQDIEGNELTGGYIIRNDKTTDLGPGEWWDSPIPHPYGRLSQFQYYDPKYDDMLPQQRSYIKDYMKLYEQVMVASSFKDSLSGYRKYSNIQSFIDMMFINELSMDVDCYHFSTYFYKDKDSDGGKLYSGPVWDKNIAWGNVNYGNVDADDGFIYTRGGRMYYWKRMMEDPWYANAAYSRWDKMYSSVLSWENVENIIDSCVTLMGPAIDRNYEKWPTLGTYVWPNVVWPETYEEEITMLKTFIQERLPWLNSQWGGRGTPIDYPPYISCKEDQYLPPSVLNAYIPSGDELDPTFVWDDFDIESVTNSVNGKKTLKEAYIPDGTTIVWTATDSKGQQTSCSMKVFVDPDHVQIEEYLAHNFKTYPNPANDFFNIESTFPVKDIIIQTMDGKTVQQIIAEGRQFIQVNTSSYSSGMYLLIVRGENGARVHQLQLISR